MTPGDTVDGSPSSSQHLIAAILKEPQPVSLSHQCVTVDTDVTVEITDQVS